MNLSKLFTEYLRKVQGLPLPAQHRHFTMMLADSSYQWGRENLIGTDCSGSLSWPLLCLRHNIRVTADEFYKKIYIHHVHQPARFEHRVMAVFCILGGKAKHVMPIVGENVVLDADGPVGSSVTIKDANGAIDSRIRRGYSIDIRELDWDQVHAHEGEAWGVDELILHLRGLL
jgi:hypothetical protein